LFVMFDPSASVREVDHILSKNLNTWTCIPGTVGPYLENGYNYKCQSMCTDTGF